MAGARIVLPPLSGNAVSRFRASMGWAMCRLECHSERRKDRRLVPETITFCDSQSAAIASHDNTAGRVVESEPSPARNSSFRPRPGRRAGRATGDAFRGYVTNYSARSEPAVPPAVATTCPRRCGGDARGVQHGLLRAATVGSRRQGSDRTPCSVADSKRLLPNHQHRYHHRAGRPQSLRAYRTDRHHKQSERREYPASVRAHRGDAGRRHRPGARTVG